jgi:hypothetical protein
MAASLAVLRLAGGLCMSILALDEYSRRNRAYIEMRIDEFGNCKLVNHCDYPVKIREMQGKKALHHLLSPKYAEQFQIKSIPSVIAPQSKVTIIERTSDPVTGKVDLEPLLRKNKTQCKYESTFGLSTLTDHLINQASRQQP